MSKTSNYETALKLSQITGRPLEEFYNGDNDKSKTNENCKAKPTKDSGKIEHIQANDSNSSIRESSGDKCEEVSNGDTSTYLETLRKTYSAEIINGKIMRGRQMTRKEYLAEKRKFKSSDEFWVSPLIYKMFRAEGQVTPSFVEWTTNMEKELDK